MKLKNSFVFMGIGKIWDGTPDLSVRRGEAYVLSMSLSDLTFRWCRAYKWAYSSSYSGSRRQMFFMVLWRFVAAVNGGVHSAVPGGLI